MPGALARLAPIPSPITPQHAIRYAVAMARLVGVPASVHVRQVERPDGAQHAGVREELAD